MNKINKSMKCNKIPKITVFLMRKDNPLIKLQKNKNRLLGQIKSNHNKNSPCNKILNKMRKLLKILIIILKKIQIKKIPNIESKEVLFLIQKRLLNNKIKNKILLRINRNRWIKMKSIHLRNKNPLKKKTFIPDLKQDVQITG